MKSFVLLKFVGMWNASMSTLQRQASVTLVFSTECLVLSSRETGMLHWKHKRNLGSSAALDPVCKQPDLCWTQGLWVLGGFMKQNKRDVSVWKTEICILAQNEIWTHSHPPRKSHLRVLLVIYKNMTAMKKITLCMMIFFSNVRFRGHQRETCRKKRSNGADFSQNM